jgi:SanA protein
MSAGFCNGNCRLGLKVSALAGVLPLMANSKAMPRLMKLLLWCVTIVAVVTGACNWWLLQANAAAIHTHPALITATDVALVLGTAPRLSSGPNRFFEARMNTAAQLWRERKARHFLVSGDHGTKEYDEVTAMRDALVARGVPPNAITLDHAGFRTFDSMVRARQVFGVERMIVVTDDWHLPRALFLADAAGIETEGACFESVPWQASAKTRAREWFSRVKAVADVYVLSTKPKFLGERVELQIGKS